MATLFEAYVTNAGKYSEGQLVGETLKFPTTAQEVEALETNRRGWRPLSEIFYYLFRWGCVGLYDYLSEYEIWTSWWWALLKRSGVEGVRYQENFITSFEGMCWGSMTI